MWVMIVSDTSHCSAFRSWYLKQTNAHKTNLLTPIDVCCVTLLKKVCRISLITGHPNGAAGTAKDTYTLVYGGEQQMRGK